MVMLIMSKTAIWDFGANVSYLENRSLLQTKRKSLWLLGEAGGRMGEGIVREFRMDMYTLLYLKWITNKNLLCSTGNSAQRYVAPGWEGSLGENGYVY